MDKKYMNCTRCELCGTADVIYGSTFMEYSILFRLLTAPLATMGMGMLSATIVKTKGIHINTKVILLVLCISAIICNTGILVDCLYKFFISNVMPNYMQCDFQVFNPQYGIVIRHIEILGAMCLSTSSIALAVERTVATIFYRNYSSKPTLGSILAVIQILVSFLPIWNVHTPKQMYPYSPPELHAYKLYHSMNMWQTILNVIAFFIFIILWIINYTRKAPIILVLCLMVFASELVSSKLLEIELEHVLFTDSHPLHTIYNEDTVVTHQVLSEVIEYSFYPELQLTLIPIMFIALILVLITISKKLRDNFLLVSNLSICFPVKVHTTDSRSSSESSSSEGSSERIHWNRKIDGLSITTQGPKF
ncbi:Protein CBG16352 [Caenorhabditis briggsae]|uniref:Protein CBG16352 n=1 Tax=Caenorhabditis briggsae TaxID=6238 RepID=A8XNM3_CAEBR|nr:Protein CBG16352 [Caenorhabditis briggsae]CAP34112.2 Protein CBG16352 [Caenorhabditis briggsae]